MKKIIKSSFVLALLVSVITSCSKEEDFEIAPYKQVIVSANFEAHLTGSGTSEVAINLPGWGNYTVVGTRKWHCRNFSNNNYAEFSSFYSAAGTSDEQWLVLPKMELTKYVNEVLIFKTKTRFANGAVLSVLVSTDFNGTQAGISTATWTPLSPTLPTTDDVFVDSGLLDLSSYNSDNVYVAFKYVGSKQGGTTTTFQVDDIKVYEK